MRTYTIGDFKANLSDILESVRAGESIALAYGQKKEVIAYLVPPKKIALKKRQLGLLEGKAIVSFKDNFKISEDEFLG
jgi:antitoxin (DNA-binding transcriptional repressor) of toxin-antitoxin stability system